MRSHRSRLPGSGEAVWSEAGPAVVQGKMGGWGLPEEQDTSGPTSLPSALEALLDADLPGTEPALGE